MGKRCVLSHLELNYIYMIAGRVQVGGEAVCIGRHRLRKVHVP